MSDNGNLSQGSVWHQMWDAITSLFIGQHRQVVTLLRTPTPVKITQDFTVEASGCIGGGLTSPDPKTIYRCPMSSEAWINRFTITSPEHGPNAPLTAGEIFITGSTSGEVIWFLPQSGAVAPVQIAEGRLSAPHLNPGEQLWIVGDQLPVGHHFRIDLQIMLVTGLSEYTPPDFAPGKVSVDEEVIA